MLVYWTKHGYTTQHSRAAQNDCLVCVQLCTSYMYKMCVLIRCELWSEGLLDGLHWRRNQSVEYSNPEPQQLGGHLSASQNQPTAVLRVTYLALSI